MRKAELMNLQRVRPILDEPVLDTNIPALRPTPFKKQMIKPIKNKPNTWYDWLASHVPEPIKSKTSSAFPTLKNNILNLYNQTFKSPKKEVKTNEKLDFTPAEQDFDKEYRRYRLNNGKIDIEIHFQKMRKNLIELINRQIKDLGSATMQTTVWIKWRKTEEEILVDKAFRSKMTELFQGSDYNEILDKLFAEMKT